jgi:hypothetical protein
MEVDALIGAALGPAPPGGFGAPGNGPYRL